jgi:hypothetical protein
MATNGCSPMFMAPALSQTDQILSIGSEIVMWIFLGDFNFYISLENRNKPGGNLTDTLIFNDAIDHLDLIELPLKGRAYTWSNMKTEPLLEQLDWFFTSPN